MPKAIGFQGFIWIFQFFFGFFPMILDVSGIIQSKQVESLMVSHAPSVPQVAWLATPQRNMGDVCICFEAMPRF